LIFNELSTFVKFFINFSLRYETSHDLLIDLCETFVLDQSRAHLLLTELQSNQKNTANMFSAKDQMIYSLQRRGDRYQRFGMDHMLVMGMTIKYID